jgi:glucans biosynthesis protein C
MSTCKYSPAFAIFIFSVYTVLGFGCVILKVPGSIPTCMVCAIPVLYTICYKCSNGGSNTGSTQLSTLEGEDGSLLLPTSKQRSHYLDNLKVFLTATVVMHHTICAFVGTSWFYGIGNFKGNTFKSFGNATLLLNQSYFMSLFFFISGYFIPPSYNKKTTDYQFLCGKLKRLGVPFYFFSCILNPLLIVMIIFCFNNGEYKGGDLSYGYYFLPGVAWYIAWLLLFSALYTTIKKQSVGKRSDPVAKPSLISCLVYGFVVGMIQLLILAVFPTIRAFGMMPITFGSLPMDILFFIAGTYARGGKWLANNAQTSFVNATERKFVTCFTICSILLCYIVSFCMELGFIGPKYGYGVWALFSGPYAVSMSIFLIDLFQRLFNYKSERTSFFTRSAYMVYLFHPFVLVSLTFVYNYILKHGLNVIVEFENHSFASTTPIPSEYVWIGFIAVGFATQIVVWPLSHFLRQLPGVRNFM